MADTVVFIRPVPRDKFGDLIPDVDPVETTSEGWLVAPGDSTEITDGQNSVDTVIDLYRTGELTEDVLPKDQARVRGHVYEVSGEPQQWPLGTVIHLTKFTG